MEILLRFAVYAASVAVSNKFAAGYWVVGPVFGLAVLVFLWRRAKAYWPGAAAYVAASTLIYALVYRIAGFKWGASSSDFSSYFIGPFPVAVLVGSILLPCAHAIILRCPRALAWRTVAMLAASFYFVTFLAYLNSERGIGPYVSSWLPIMIAVWQGVYLLSFKEKNND